MGRRLAGLALAGLALVSVAGCSKRQIDVDQTGSVKVEGTSWYRFCDGPNAVMWVKGHGGDSDEIEAYVYDHWACLDGATPGTNRGPESTPDGTVEDEG